MIKRGLAPQVIQFVDEKLASPTFTSFRYWIWRAKAHANMEQWEQAELDLKQHEQWLTKVMSLTTSHGLAGYYFYMPEAVLLEGFLRLRIEGEAAAKESWRRGISDDPRFKEEPSKTGEYWILKSICEDLSDSDVSVILERAGISSAAPGTIQQSLKSLSESKIFGDMMRNLLRSEHGRKHAERFAMGQIYRWEARNGILPIALYEMIHQAACNGVFSEEQDTICWELAERMIYAVSREGTIQLPQIGLLGVTFRRGEMGFLGWSGVALSLKNEVRWPFAYFLSHRLLNLNRVKDAENLMKSVVKNCEPDSKLGKLAKSDLELLTNNQGILIVQSKTANSKSLQIVKDGQVAQTVMIEKLVEVRIDAGLYQLKMESTDGQLSSESVEIKLCQRILVEVK